MTTLRELARRHFRKGGYTPNASDTPERVIVDQPAVIAQLVQNIQAGANDIGRWTEDEWRDVLSEECGVEDDYMSDALEQVASWGVVDDSYYFPEEEGG
jgi:hypothetical protein